MLAMIYKKYGIRRFCAFIVFFQLMMDILFVRCSEVPVWCIEFLLN